MKKLLTSMLVLAMSLSLLTPALAVEAPEIPSVPDVFPDVAVAVTTTPDESLSDGEPEWEAEKTAWLAAHPEEAASFDADAWFASIYGDYSTKEDYLYWNGSTEEDFQQEMLDEYIAFQLYQEERRTTVEAYETAHPGTLAAFDADAWFETNYGAYDYTKEEYMVLYGLATEEDFLLDMQYEYVSGLLEADNRRQRVEAYEASHPGAFAAFDADAWFAQHHPYYEKEEYMSSFSSAKDDAAFRDIMFCEYLDELDLKQAQRDEVAAYASEHPGVLEGFDPMAYLADHYGYQDPKTAFMEDYGLSDDQEFLEYLQYAYISALKARQERAARIADYEAANPGSTADFDADAYFAENYSYYTKERFMLNQELDTEEDFHDYLLCEWIDYQEYGDWWWVAPADYDAEKELLGGVPGELGIMVNGVYLQFGSDQKPYAQDGTTFVPSEILAQALGQTPKTVTTNGYSPLRASAEEAGYTVYWDQNFETAVLLDPEEAAAAMDESFTILNGALAKWAPASGQNHQTDCTIALDTTLFNSIDGDKTYAVSAAFRQLLSPAGMELSGTYDLSELEELIRGLLGDEMYDYLSQDAGTEFQALMDLLRAGDFQIRADYESGMLSVASSSFPSLFSIMGKTYPKDVWLSWDSGLTSAGATATVGAAVAAASLASDLQSPYISPVYYYQNILNAGSMTAAVLGDDQFEAKGSDHVLALDAEELTALLYGVLGDSYYYDLSFRELSLTLTVGEDGTIDGSFALRPESEYSFLLDMRLAGDWSFNGKEDSFHLELHVKNLCKMAISVESETSVTSQEPQTTPPEGDAVVPVDESFGG